jgi:hypothetical protein
MIFGHLSVLFNAPFIQAPLKNHLMACTNLCSLISRIKTEHFPVTQEGLHLPLLLLANMVGYMYHFFCTCSIEIEKKRIENEKLKKEANKKHTSCRNDDDEDEWSWRHPKRHQLIAIGVAFVSMLYFAFSNDLIKIEISDID